MAKIVSIHSYRGGTGKSNIAANLAMTVALQGARVGIVDADIQSPGTHVLFGLDEGTIGRTLNDYLWGHCPIEDASYAVSPTLHGTSPSPAAQGSAAYLIPSSMKAADIARVLREGYDVDLLSDGFQAAIERLELDYLFVDTHPGLNEETLLAMTVSDLVLLVLRPDRQDYQGTAVTVEVARKLDVLRMLLVMNVVLPGFDAEALRQEVERAYQVPVAGILPLAEEVVRFASSGIFCLHHPDHPWSQGVRAIASQIVGD